MISLREFESTMPPTHKIDNVEGAIYLIRGQRVMLDSDLAKIYGTSTMRLNEQFRRNRRRFPVDFAFVLTREEFTNLISQNAISSSHGGRRKSPVAFTEHGAIMLADKAMWERPQRRDVIPNCLKIIGALRPLPHS